MNTVTFLKTTKTVIDKRLTSVEMCEKSPAAVKTIKTNKTIFEDMKACIQSIDCIEVHTIFGLYGDGVELNSTIIKVFL